MSSRFRYLEWVLASFPRARWNLANSAVAVPPRALAGDAFGEPPPIEPHAFDARARAAVAHAFGVAPSRVMLAQGTSGANFLVFSAHVAPGDVVAVEAPAYEPLLVVPESLGARLVRYPAHDPDGLGRALDAAGGRAALVVATSPHNPTGAVLEPAAAAALAEAAARRGARLLLDEVYLDALAAPPPSGVTLPGTFVTGSLTKSYGLGALRFGWAIAPDADGAAALLDRSLGAIGALATPLLALGISALERRDALLARARSLLATNHAAWRALSAGASGRLVPSPAPPGVIAWAELPGTDTRAFAERLLAERSTLVAPGAFFGADGFLRVGLGGEVDSVREGLAHLGEAVRAR